MEPAETLCAAARRGSGDGARAGPLTVSRRGQRGRRFRTG